MVFRIDNNYLKVSVLSCCCAALFAPTGAQAQEDVVEDINRQISTTVIDKEELAANADSFMRAGHEAFRKGDYQAAIDQYLEAVKILRELSDGGSTLFKKKLSDCRDQIAQSYFYMSENIADQAEELSLAEDYDKAIELCKKAAEVYPASKAKMDAKIAQYEKEKAAVARRTEVKEADLIPDKENREYTIGIELARANKLFQAKEYARARDAYERVLRIDVYNTEATTGLGACNLLLAKAADRRYGIVHKEMIAEATWNGVTPLDSLTNFDGGTLIEAPIFKTPDGEMTLQQKLDNIIIPEVNCEDLKLPAAIRYIVELSKENDPEGKGINIFLMFDLQKHHLRQQMEKMAKAAQDANQNGMMMGPGGMMRPGMGQYPPGMNPGMQPGMSPSGPGGYTPGMPGMNPGGMNPGMQPGMGAMGPGGYGPGMQGGMGAMGPGGYGPGMQGGMGTMGQGGYGDAANYDSYAYNPMAVEPEEPEYPSVNFVLNDKSLGEAIKVLCQTLNLKYRVEKYSVVIASEDYALDEMETQIFPLNREVLISYGDGEVGPVLAEFFKGYGVTFPLGSRIVFDQRISRLIVTNTRENLQKIDRIIQTDLSIKEPMVEIQAKFVEVTQNDLQELGFNYAIANNPVSTTPIYDEEGELIGYNTVGNRDGKLEFDENDNTLNSLDPEGDDIFTYNRSVNGFDFSFSVRALNQLNSEDMLFSPRILTLNGQPALIRMVKEMYFPDEYDEASFSTSDSNTNDNNNNSMNTYTYISPVPVFDEAEQFGIQMLVTPEVDIARKLITLRVKPTVRTFVGWTTFDYEESGDDNFPVLNLLREPVVAERLIDTLISIKDGETVALGGIIKDEVTTIDDKIPILGDVPLIGRFFQSKGSSGKKTNLLIFLTCKLVNPDGSAYFPDDQVQTSIPSFPTYQ